MAKDLVTGADLRKYFRESEVRQSTLARLLGISERQVNRFVNGRAQIPQATQIAIYALIHWNSPFFTRFITDVTCRDNQAGKQS